MDENPSMSELLFPAKSSTKWITPYYITYHMVLFPSWFCFFCSVWLCMHIIQNSKCRKENIVKVFLTLPQPPPSSPLPQKAAPAKTFLGLLEKIQMQAGAQEAAFSWCCLRLAFLTERASVTLYSDWMLSLSFALPHLTVLSLRSDPLAIYVSSFPSLGPAQHR